MSLEQLEELRKKARSRKILIGVLSALCIIAGYILAMISDVRSISYIGFVLAGVITKALYEPIKKYSESYKDTFVVSELENTFNNLIYKPFEGIDELVLKSTGMIRTGNTYDSNDYIEADYNGVHFKQADVCLSNQGRNGKTIIFQGRWMIFDFNKEFKTNMQILHKSFSASSNPNGLFFNKNELKYNDIKVENDQFNNAFIIRAQDEHNAYYILTPHFMEKMLQVSSDVGKSMMFCFMNNQLYVAINTHKDSFEHSAFSKIDPAVEKEEIVKDISLITEFVDELNLDRKLFKE